MKRSALGGTQAIPGARSPGPIRGPLVLPIRRDDRQVVIRCTGLIPLQYVV
jgi:hypothetical protein